MLKITESKGLHLKFENGFTISVQWGTGNYCEKQQFGPYGCEKGNDIWESANAEIAIWDKNGKWFDFGSDTVKGWVCADEVAEWINRTKNATSIDNL